MPDRKPRPAAKPADKVMAIKDIGAASIILRFKKNTNSGKESIAPPAPVMASTKSHKLQDGTDYYGINPLGYVPMLELDDGTRLREGPAIVQYIADLAPAKNLAPAAGTMQRYRLQE